MLYIVLDKSYLDAANKEEMFSLCNKNTVLMTDVLFHELLTTRDESRMRCFNKFPDKAIPVELIPNIETLFHYEQENKKQCTPLIDRKVNEIFKFNDKMRNGTFSFTDDQKQFIEKRKSSIESDTKSFFELAMLVPGFFADLKKLPFKKLPEAIEDAKRKITLKYNKVREIYEAISNFDKSKYIVKSDMIDDDWACFRYLQVRVLYSLDLLLKYQGRLPDEPSQKFWRRIEHDLQDSEYVMIGALSGALASNEKRMIAYFKEIRPSGKVFSIIRE